MGFVLGGSLGTKPCVFPCKVGPAPAGDGRYLVCAAVAGTIVLILFFAAVELWLQGATDSIVCAQL